MARLSFPLVPFPSSSFSRSLCLSLAHSLTRSFTEAVRVLESGVPVVTLSTRHSYLYSVSMRVWMRATDTLFAQSEYLSVLPLVQQAGMEPARHSLPLELLQVRDTPIHSLLSISVSLDSSHTRTLPYLS